MPERVRLISDPILRVVCPPVDDIDVVFTQCLLDTMYQTMIAENGLGLAANQIGVPTRIFILKTEDSYKEYINPVITEASELVDFEAEACLSIPGTQAPTKRFKHLHLKWLSKDSVAMEGDFEDLRAFAVQHEIDHLDGKLYIDQFGPLKRNMVLTKHRKFLKRG